MASFSETLRAFSRVLTPEDPEGLVGIGNITTREDRKRAIDVSKDGGTIQLIVGSARMNVGGIFFDVDNPTAVERVVSIKSVPGHPRTKLFGVMMPDDDLIECLGTEYRLRVENIQSPCFIQAPVKDWSSFPEWARSVVDDVVYVQCFPSDHVPHFGNLVREARKENIRLGGTSLNLSGSKNIQDHGEAAAFFYLSSGRRYWLETGLDLTGTSYAIIRLHEERPEAELIRDGNVTLEEICKQLGITPVTSRRK